MKRASLLPALAFVCLAGGASPDAATKPSPASSPAAVTRPAPEAPPAPAIERSTVRIVNHSQRPSWFAPWSGGSTQWTTGSGFVIEGGLILTSAHVVSDARFLAVFLHGDPAPHEARLVVSGHDCDLALIRPVEPSLLAAIPALPLGDLPPMRSVVETYGYPAGGDQISSTRGVVSRIDRQIYSHSAADAHLAVQTDAAINPGNSGGPVVQDGRIVGVAFQNSKQLQSVGFFVPTEVIRHFLADAADGRYDGYPDLAVRVAPLENPAARRHAAMPEGETGVRVEWTAPDGSADGALRVGDILLRIDGQPIANDGSVAAGGLRLPYGLLVDRHQIGEPLALVILRAGTRADLKLPLKPFPANQRWSNQYDRRPRYYIYGGLVFVPLDREMVKTFGDEWMADADSELVHELLFRWQGEPEILRQERVVLLRRLDHPVNAGLSFFKNILVDRVNGRPIGSLAGLVQAIEENREPFQVFELAYFGRLAVLEREAADGANADILRDYAIPRDRNL
ncbi:MAG: S1C family serine protease [Candidatus Polarisedimenticolia bacterium]